MKKQKVASGFPPKNQRDVGGEKATTRRAATKDQAEGPSLPILQSQDDAVDPQPRELGPSDPGFGDAVRLVSEARRTMGRDAALALWRKIGLPWVPELNPKEDGVGKVATFIAEQVVAARGSRISAHDAWNAYNTWCAQRGKSPTSRTKFGIDFPNLAGQKLKRSSGIFYGDVRLRENL